MIKFVNEKKGASIPIVILVIAIIILCGFVLFYFFKKVTGIKQEFVGFSEIERVYGKERQLKQEIEGMVELAALKAYSKAVQRGGVVKGGDDEVLRKRFLDEFEYRLQVEFNKRDEEENFRVLGTKLFNKQVRLEFDNRILRLDFGSALVFSEEVKEEIEGKIPRFKVIYKPELSFELNLDEIGLARLGYEDIAKGARDCDESFEREQEDWKSCYEDYLKKELANFDYFIYVSEDDYVVVTLTSKREFLIDNGLETIGFSVQIEP